MKPLIVIRPEPGCAATVATAKTLGLDAFGFPLFQVRSQTWDSPDCSHFDALLAGSANAFRHGGSALTNFRALPAYVVGEATAQEAHAAGFADILAGSGGLQSLLDRLAPQHRRLLRLTGRKRVPLAPPPGVTIEERIVYDSVPLSMRDNLAAMLADDCVVLLHSAEAARHFAEQCEIGHVARHRVALAALAPRIAEAAGTGWAEVNCAELPRDDALLALARDMCQSRGRE
ncbi:MAG: uroporphyrinogen-III synthase [Novosphingobium sp.]